MYFFTLLLNNLGDGIEQESKCYTIGDGVGERHERDDHECRNCNSQVVPVNILQTFRHEDTYNNQCRSSRCAWNHQCDRRKE